MKKLAGTFLPIACVVLCALFSWRSFQSVSSPRPVEKIQLRDALNQGPAQDDENSDGQDDPSVKKKRSGGGGPSVKTEDVSVAPDAAAVPPGGQAAKLKAISNDADSLQNGGGSDSLFDGEQKADVLSRSAAGVEGDGISDAGATKAVGAAAAVTAPVTVGAALNASQVGGTIKTLEVPSQFAGSDGDSRTEGAGDPAMPRFIAPPGLRGRVDLSEIDPSDTGDVHRKKALKKHAKDEKTLDELQQVLYAEGKHSVLIIFQGMDTSGKDGVVRSVMRSLNPQGVQVTSFKKPTAEEASHDFLWRIRNALPRPGMIEVFNRSQYEDILVPTVYKTFSKEEVESRYDTINQFERQLTSENVIILKFFLYISKDEQKDRLQARLDDPDKNWKFSESDLPTRKKWPQFMGAYERVLARTNTPWAPWYVIPANNKWYRDYLVGRILRKTLQRLDMKYPPARPGLDKIKIPD